MKKNNEKQMTERNEELENLNPAQELVKSERIREKNSVELCGFVGFDPEVREFASGKKKIRFRIATHTRYASDGESEPVERTHWFPVVVWNKTAEEALGWLRRGNKVLVKGYLNYQSFEDKDGNKRTLFETVATELVSVA